MGQRANYAVFENGNYRLFYSHWAANTIDRDLFWGPRAALTFIMQQKELRQDDWLDDIWCEGGAVVNLDCKRLTIFGGEDIKYEIPLRRLYLRMLANAWEGWQVHWAHEGIADLADAVGYPRNKVLAKETSAGQWPALRAAGDDSVWINALVSVAGNGGLQIYPLTAFVVDRVLEDANFLNHLLCMHPLTEFQVPKEKGFPGSGLHLDLTTKAFQIWTASPQPNFIANLRRAWRDWHIQWHFDRHEFHEAITGGRVRLPVFTDQELLPRITEIVMRDLHRENPVQRFESMTKSLQDAGHDVQVSSAATSWHVDGLPSREEREKIWLEILQSLRLR